jgi:hypothetical protein
MPRAKRIDQLTYAEWQALRPCRVFSSVGSCLTQYRYWRTNAKSVSCLFWNGARDDTGQACVDRFPACSVHYEPCVCCSGRHEGSMYPDGYYG